MDESWPGMTMGQWGFSFRAHGTWWDEGKPWIDYISHCQFLLQQGRAVRGRGVFHRRKRAIGNARGQSRTAAGYDYETPSMRRAAAWRTVKSGRLTLTSGANYAALILPTNDADITPQFWCVSANSCGGERRVVGARPQPFAESYGFPKCDAQVKKIAAELWGNAME